jgi:hypothetical protein
MARCADLSGFEIQAVKSVHGLRQSQFLKPYGFRLEDGPCRVWPSQAVCHPDDGALMAVVGDPRGSLAATSDQSLLLQRLKTQASVIDGIGILPALQLSDA